jgi:hypothetical protein
VTDFRLLASRFDHCYQEADHIAKKPARYKTYRRGDIISGLSEMDSDRLLKAKAIEFIAPAPGVVQDAPAAPPAPAAVAPLPADPVLAPATPVDTPAAESQRPAPTALKAAWVQHAAEVTGVPAAELEAMDKSSVIALVNQTPAAGAE